MTSVVVTLEAEEGKVSRGPNGERRESVSRCVMNKLETHFGGILPMGIGRFAEKIDFLVNVDTPPTVVNDQAFRREYTLRIKGLVGGIWSSIEVTFPITIAF